MPNLKNHLLENAAMVAHETNRSYCQSIGDNSQMRWKDAPEWQRESARQGVIFHCKNPKADTAASHENWFKQKQEDGWSYGPTKDPENKKHPCMVPYKELPVEQQIKDYIFKNVVHGYLNARGHYVEGEIMIGPLE